MVEPSETKGLPDIRAMTRPSSADTAVRESGNDAESPTVEAWRTDVQW